MQKKNLALEDRNKAIVEDYMRYRSYRAVGDKYGLSLERTRQIVKKAERIKPLDVTDTDGSRMYKAITTLPISKTYAYRLYYALTRININTLDQLKTYNRKMLTGKKNIGTVSINALLEAGLIEK